MTPSPLIQPPQPSAASLPTSAIYAAAQVIVDHVSRGQAVDRSYLRSVLNACFGGTDAQGAWCWKDAYEACEAAQVLFLRRYSPALKIGQGQLTREVDIVSRLLALFPTHTIRAVDATAYQQFSTPLPLAACLARAARISPQDMVLEPSAGTGLLAVFAGIYGATAHLNEIAPLRRALLGHLFAFPVTAHDAITIDDRLERTIVPSVVLMNPPFSAAINVEGRSNGADSRHLASAYARLCLGGRLVAITGPQADLPNIPGAALRLDVGLAPGFFRNHGTAIATRLLVLDKITSDRSCETIRSDSIAAYDDLIPLVEAVPDRAAPASTHLTPAPALKAERPPAPVSFARKATEAPASTESFEPLAYEVLSAAPPNTQKLSDSLYDPYVLETIRFEEAHAHPTRLVQSAAMASVRLPPPSYRPLLSKRVVSDGLLSDAQLESVIYAGQAHQGFLSGSWRPSETYETLAPAADYEDGALRYRRGWFLGDGTGAGKGRQIAGILLDNWNQGRRRALWISKSDKLIEDAQRDWAALGCEKLLIVPQDRFRQGTPITLEQGILFTTYATLRSAERAGKASRLTQILDWLGTDFDGVVIFDEAHAMANAASTKSARGDRGPSQQGLTGLRLQHALPAARIVYVSATGATDVQNLAYAQRLGLWGAADFPFASRSEFISAMQRGGIAAIEVLARDLKALGLYTARSLSYEGVTVAMLEHTLTTEQTRIYDEYARAFQIIHTNLDAALKAAGVTSDAGTLNAQAKSAARSAFESNKQRFFNHLITAMKVPTLISALQSDLDAGRAPIIQIVSTSEALMERRIADIPADEWGDLSVDITPREYVLDYLAHGFPTQLFETFTDEEGNLHSRPALVDGQPIECRQAAALRDAMIEHLAALPPVQSALDQIIQHFGTERVAEVTGRARRIVRKDRLTGPVLALESRPPSSNLSETQSFMDDRKNILIFSDAGGTGRSYHADLAARNQRLRVHYLLEAGWKADTAIQGLGRSNRTNQKQPPVFRPVTTDIRGERRFLSTIARRLDSLGAITRGQRQTGGQGLFRPEDNLESPYARAALIQLYRQVARGQIAACSLATFEAMTGLALLDADGSLLEDLPPTPRFLNRLLALPIELQNALFDRLEDLLRAIVERAIASGTYEVGLETIRAHSLQIAARTKIAMHERSEAETILLTVARQDRNTPLALAEALKIDKGQPLAYLHNARSARAAVLTQGPSITLEDGSTQRLGRLIRPLGQSSIVLDEMADTHWQPIDRDGFTRLWAEELAQIPEFSTSQFHIVTGLLLPIWHLLPDENTRVYRFQTDDGEKIIGRLIDPTSVARLTSELAFSATASELYEQLTANRPVTLPGGWSLKTARVMNARRIELTGFTASEIPRLKTLGLFSEIIAWKTRLFVPMGEASLSVPILDRLITQARSSLAA